MKRKEVFLTWMFALNAMLISNMLLWQFVAAWWVMPLINIPAIFGFLMYCIPEE